MWVSANSHEMQTIYIQHFQNVNVWAEIMVEKIISSLFFENTGEQYQQFLRLKLMSELAPLFPNEINLVLPNNNVWFQNDLRFDSLCN